MDNARTGPGFGPRIAQLFEERVASPFEAARFARLPVAAQIAGMIALDLDPEADVRELISDLEERVS
jgi:hypothetical protein